MHFEKDHDSNVVIVNHVSIIYMTEALQCDEDIHEDEIMINDVR